MGSVARQFLPGQNMDALTLARMAFALIAVLGLIGLCAALAKKAGLANGAALGRRKRLQVVEQIALDARRRAAILKCDGREHLIILGPTSELLIDRDLPAPEAAAEPVSSVHPAFRQALAASLRREPVVSVDAA